MMGQSISGGEDMMVKRMDMLRRNAVMLKARPGNRPIIGRHSGSSSRIHLIQGKEKIMKIAIAFTTLAMMAVPVWASDQDNNPDQKQGISNVHDTHFPHVAGDSHEPERGSGDGYGSIMLDINANERHVPHKPGDHHAPEKGSGDDYGQITR